VAVSAILPAYNEARRIAATIQALRSISVEEVIVVDDASSDGTAAAAAAAGADRVLRLPRNAGKGAALWAGSRLARNDLLLLIDADLQETASQAKLLLEPVEAGEADMTIATFPRLARRGGFGLVVGLARGGLRLLTGRSFEAPLSGQRALRRDLLDRVALAERWGVDLTLTAEAHLVGAVIREVPTQMSHHHTGRDIPGIWHRAAQFIHALTTLVSLIYGLGWPALSRARRIRRWIIWLAFIALLPVLGYALRGLCGPDFSPSLPWARPAWWGLLSALVLWAPALWVCQLLGLHKQNYQGRIVPGASGIIFCLVGAIGFSRLPEWAAGTGAARIAEAGLVLVVGWTVLGIVDDRFGSRRAGGFFGHVRAARHGFLTTGLLKAGGGGVLSLYVAWRLTGAPLETVVDGLLLALAANFLNLLDKRPGRALKGFWLLSAAAIAAQPASWWLLAPMLATSVIIAPADLAGRAMLGDVGANLLGAMAGLGLAANLHGGLLISDTVAVILLLGLVHVYAEFGSITECIARRPILSFFDNLGRSESTP
jgi:hypothetical protein